MTLRKRRSISLGALKIFKDELNSVRNILPSAFGGFDEDDEDGEGDTEEPGQITSEEVEVALSAVVSTMVVECDLPEEPDTLTELMEVLFTPDDDLVGVAANLEEAVNGYFGELFGEDLDLADGYLAEIVTILGERIEKWKSKEKSRLNLKNE